MAKLKTRWQDKLNNDKGLPKIEAVKPTMSQRWGKGDFVIPAPREVDGIMKLVPEGKLITINQIREVLAKKHRVNFACPITTGIFAWIAANAAGEAATEGEKDITPYWRTLKTGGELNPKYPGGVEGQAELLQKEGHTVIPGKGKKSPTVKDYEKKLVEV
jgi:hypothetical protein